MPKRFTMKTKLLFLSGLLLFILNIHRAQAQTSPDSLVYRVETRDGNSFIGTILDQDTERIILRTTRFGEITILKRDITRMAITKADGLSDQPVMFENPQSTRYFWSPNGYGLRRGEAYYQNVWVLFNQASVGVTDNFSVGAGMMPLFLFAGAPTPVWFTPKLSFPVVKDRVNIGAGALVGTVIGGGETFNGSAGLLYGLSTFGSRDKNMTIGLGYGFAEGEIASTPVLTVSGMLRTGPRGYLLTENYLIRSGDQTVGLLMVGGRRIIQKAGLDFGLVIPTGTGESFIALPWLGLTIPFGNVR